LVYGARVLDGARAVGRSARVVLPLALALAVLETAAAPAASVPRRTVSLKGELVTFPALALDPADHLELPINLIISAEEKTLLATLLHRGWNLHARAQLGEQQVKVPAHEYRLEGRAPALELEHSAGRIDERLRALIWLHPEKGSPAKGRLPVWVVSVSKEAGVRPLAPPSKPAKAEPEALSRTLADLSYGLAQTRTVGEPASRLPHVTWVELAEPP
jgi:hypothetical protein